MNNMLVIFYRTADGHLMRVAPSQHPTLYVGNGQWSGCPHCMLDDATQIDDDEAIRLSNEWDRRVAAGELPS